jgi:Family of unknown function (DUF6152)
MKIKISFLLAAMLLASSFAVYAHHSFAATYHQDQTVTIEGRMVQFSFRNPHSIVQVESTDPKTGKIRWTIEWAGSTQLVNTGVTNDSLKYGDVVIITGNPGRNPDEHRIRLVTVKRSDGTFSWGTKAGETNDQ